MQNNELKHYGVKGMKWGENRMMQEYIPVSRQELLRRKKLGIKTYADYQKKANATTTAGNKTIAVVKKSTASAASKNSEKYNQERESRRQETMKQIGSAGEESNAKEAKETKTKKTASKTTSKAVTRKKTTKTAKEVQKSLKDEFDVEVPEQINDEAIDSFALNVIRGAYGNGLERKEKLGENYAIIQARVNEIMKELVAKKKAAGSK